MPAPPVIGALRDAAAERRLIIISGAGISTGLQAADGSGPLPNWGKLVADLRARCDLRRIDPAKRALLDELMPADLLDELHGDALIEASEIIQQGFAPGCFEPAIAERCREKDGECSDVHDAIAEIGPAGIITFNYDRAHEEAFQRARISCEPIIYDEHDTIRALLARRTQGPPFVLKAHGCTTRPETLVLTSSSYRRVLSGNRAYRMLLQHSLVGHAVLIVGFGLRDRDFDHLLATLEVELGKPLHRSAFMTLRPGADREGRKKLATWASVTARFGVEPIYLDNYAEMPGLIRSIASTPGPLIDALVEAVTSTNIANRETAHDRIQLLGKIGRKQVCAALLTAMDAADDPIKRSELIYALRGVADADVAVARRLIAEIQSAVGSFVGAARLGSVECAAHALLTLRRGRMSDRAVREEILDALKDAKLLDALARMDEWAADAGEVRRLVSFAHATAAEIEARSRA